MSKSQKSRSTADKQLDEKISTFCNVTGASSKDARSFLNKYKRMDAAVDAFYSDPQQFSGASGVRKSEVERTQKLNALFESYKEPDGDEIGLDGTIKFCEDLEVDPEDVVLLAVAYELKSPSIGRWTKSGWIEGWKSLNVESLDGMKRSLQDLSTRLGSEYPYFKDVYLKTFEFSRLEGQRIIGVDIAQGFWAILIPHGLAGGALAHVPSSSSPRGRDEDEEMDDSQEQGWNDTYTQWWIEFLNEKGLKGVSRDLWNMFLEFVRSIDSKFQKYDEAAAWPSVIDEFVAWSRKRILSGA